MTGLVGKLPAHGDFVRRGGPPTVLRALDEWLDRELAADPMFRDRIDRLDGWRFVATVEGQALLGVVVASEDAVGRRFPLIATLTLADGDAVDAEEADAWAAAAMQAMDDGRNAALRADAVASAVDAIARPGCAADAGTGVAAGWWRDGDDRVIPSDGGLPSGPVFARLIEGDGR